VSIWIRSQGKHTLINANDIWVNNNNVIYANVTSYAEPHNFLGMYNTEAEALAVLDMIEEKIGHQEVVRLFPNETWEMPRIVFQMPEAGFLGGATHDRP
jgi:hypothetical protein